MHFWLIASVIWGGALLALAVLIVNAGRWVERSKRREADRSRQDPHHTPYGDAPRLPVFMIGDRDD